LCDRVMSKEKKAAAGLKYQKREDFLLIASSLDGLYDNSLSQKIFLKFLEMENTMSPNRHAQAKGIYTTLDSFRKDLELLGASFVPVGWWLKIKPKKPLPWTRLDMRDSLAGLARITNQTW
jgi:hypothetical protein